ncbi:carboxylesterase/lipase family protein [Mycobacterium sp.]|uniref:carboxylesterase/lipase family protein n=1 Tax=Mycobacterium sp. TaxID=1785 RepID=UPI003A856F06
MSVVETTYGPVRGVNLASGVHSAAGRTVEQVTVWKGIRYAAPPVGDLRFRSPQPPQPWTEIADTTAYGPACPQPVVARMPLDLGAGQSEDCLWMNIWAPVGTEPGVAKPVMVWLHGGAYVLGAASQPLYDGRNLAGFGNAIVVTVNYRLGAFGFLDLSSVGSGQGRFDSNIGLRDALAALHWVRENIAAFGGDPGNVTLFGESAGAGMVTTLLACPAAGGLFARAIAQSSPATSVYDRDRARRVTLTVLQKLGIAESDADRVTDLPTAALVGAGAEVFNEVPVRNPGTLAFVPIVDGDLLPDYPVKLAQEGRLLPVPLIIGTNRNEAALFRLMRSPLMPYTPKAITSMFTQIAAEQPDLQLPSVDEIGAAYSGRRKTRTLSMATDVGFRMPTLWLADGHSAVAPVYLYRFDYSTPMLKLALVRAAHATELPYVWGNLGGPQDYSLKLGGVKTATAVSERVRTRWVNFATYGEPDGLPGQPSWPRHGEPGHACLVIDKHEAVASGVDAGIREAWGGEMVSFR